MDDDAMLQEHLAGPFAIHAGKLLLGLNAVVEDAEKLMLFALVFDVSQAGCAGRRAAYGGWAGGIGPGLKRVVFSGQIGDLLLCLLNRLLDQQVTVVLREPISYARGERAMLFGGEHGGLALRSAVVFPHGGFMRGQFTLKLCAVVAGGARKIELRIGKLVGIQAELAFGNLKIVSADSRLCRIFWRDGLRAGLGRQADDQVLVVFDSLLQLRDLLLEGERIAGQDAVFHLLCGLS